MSISNGFLKKDRVEALEYMVMLKVAETALSLGNVQYVVGPGLDHGKREQYSILKCT